jgi:spore coat polysaccharide biosynthesis predicted glycosyltransferase SpsG
MKIIFRTNGGKDIGLGHVYRCISLAQAIRDLAHNIIISFVANKEVKTLIEEYKFEFISSDSFDNKDIQIIENQQPSVIIFDSYLASNDYLKRLNKICKLIIFDDNNDVYDSSIPYKIINGNLHALSLDYTNKNELFLGPEYLVMKKEYWNNKKEHNKQDYNFQKSNRNDNNVISVLITTGGTDFNKIMLQFIRAFKDLKINKKLVLGPLYEEKYIEKIEKEVFNDESFELIYKPKTLKNYINDSDYIITAAGSTIYEVLTLDKFPIIYVLADNQKAIAKELEKYGIINLGYYPEIDYNYAKKIIESKEYEKTKEHIMIEMLFDMFDGNGAKRVAEKIVKEILK